jgi:hypothetical protein
MTWQRSMTLCWSSFVSRFSRLPEFVRKLAKRHSEHADQSGFASSSIKIDVLLAFFNEKYVQYSKLFAVNAGKLNVYSDLSSQSRSGSGKGKAAAVASVAECIKWGRPTLAAETAATVTVLASLLRVTVMAAAAEVVASVAAAGALRVRMGLPKQAAELDPHKPVDPVPGRA